MSGRIFLIRLTDMGRPILLNCDWHYSWGWHDGESWQSITFGPWVAEWPSLGSKYINQAPEMKAFDKRSNGADVLDRLIRLYTTVGTDCSLCIGNVKLAR